MPLSQETLSVGGQGLGEWLYDCENLVSIVKQKPRNKRPRFQVDIKAGGPAQAIIDSVFKFLPKSLLKNFGSSISSEFEGGILVILSATATKSICDGKEQKVGWDYELEVNLKGSLKIAGNSIKVELALYFTGEGKVVPCKCNAKLDPKTALAALEDPKTDVIATNEVAMFEFETSDLAELLYAPLIAATDELSTETEAGDGGPQSLFDTGLDNSVLSLDAKTRAALEAAGIANVPALATYYGVEAPPRIKGVAPEAFQDLAKRAAIAVAVDDAGAALPASLVDFLADGAEVDVPVTRREVAGLIKSSDKQLKKALDKAGLSETLDATAIRNHLFDLFDGLTM